MNAPPPPEPTPVVHRPSRAPWVAAVAFLMVVSLVGTTAAAVQTRRLREERDRRAAIEEQVAALEQRVVELEAGRVGAGGELDGPGGLGGLGGILGDLLGEGGLDGLGDLGGILDGLLGEGGLGDLEGLGELLGGGSAGELAGCATPAAADDREVPPQAVDAVDVVAARVEEDRGLEFAGPVDVTVLSPADLAGRVQRDVDESYPPAEATDDARLLAALGAVPRGTDLRAVLSELYAEQVAGFYDPETGELVVGGDGGSDASTQVFLAHELDHALTDEVLGIPDLADGFEGDDDGAAAAQAVVEGDATLVMQRYALGHLSLTEQLGMAASGAGASLGDVPPYLVAQLTFPYVVGLSYVCDTFRRGGWPAVDALYDDPPATTLEVIDPTMRGHVPADVGAPAPVGDGWRLVEDTTFGAAELGFLLQAPGGDTSRAVPGHEDAARTWRGGRVALWERDGETAVSLRLEAVDGSLCSVVESWYASAFPDAAVASTPEGPSWDGESQDAALRCDGTSVRLGIAPTPGEAAAAAG